MCNQHEGHERPFTECLNEPLEDRGWTARGKFRFARTIFSGNSMNSSKSACMTRLSLHGRNICAKLCTLKCSGEVAKCCWTCGKYYATNAMMWPNLQCERIATRTSRLQCGRQKLENSQRAMTSRNSWLCKLFLLRDSANVAHPKPQTSRND